MLCCLSQFCCLAFYSLAAAGDGVGLFVFRNGIAWGMSLEEVLKTEKADGIVTESDNGITCLHYGSVLAEDVENVQLDYAFLDNSLFFAQYYKEREPFRQDAESIHLNNSLHFLYGFPESISVDSAKRYINSLVLIYPDKYSEEEYTIEEYAAFLDKQLCFCS